ncbi:MAG: rhodanese-related sulfurtransferase [Gammaproteobacteria bacterium]|jgi:rhodanese-related sulfurtransferase
MALRTSVKQMIEQARAEITNHSAQEAHRRVQEENALLVDIRDVRELERSGAVPGALHAPRGMLEFWIDPDSTYFRTVFAEDREFILF